MNYNASQIGVPYARAHRIIIDYPDQGQNPAAIIEQSLAVKLADGAVRKLENLPTLSVEFDFAADGATPIPLVSPETAAALGQDTSLNVAMLNVLAVVRSEQIKSGQ